MRPAARPKESAIGSISTRTLPQGPRRFKPWIGFKIPDIPCQNQGVLDGIGVVARPHADRAKPRRAYSRCAAIVRRAAPRAAPPRAGRSPVSSTLDQRAGRAPAAALRPDRDIVDVQLVQTTQTDSSTRRRGQSAVRRRGRTTSRLPEFVLGHVAVHGAGTSALDLEDGVQSASGHSARSERRGVTASGRPRDRGPVRRRDAGRRAAGRVRERRLARRRAAPAMSAIVGGERRQGRSPDRRAGGARRAPVDTAARRRRRTGTRRLRSRPCQRAAVSAGSPTAGPSTASSAASAPRPVRRVERRRTPRSRWASIQHADARRAAPSLPVAAEAERKRLERRHADHRPAGGEGQALDRRDADAQAGEGARARPPRRTRRRPPGGRPAPAERAHDVARQPLGVRARGVAGQHGQHAPSRTSATLPPRVVVSRARTSMLRLCRQ